MAVYGRGIAVALNDKAAQAATDERELAARLFNDTWALLEKEARTPEEDDRMVHMAHASRFHWDNRRRVAAPRGPSSAVRRR